MTVLTRWHRLRDAAAGPNLCLAVDAKVARAVADLAPGTFDRPAFEAFLDEAGSCPRFVIPRRLAEMTVTEPAKRSLADMHVCGVVGMPFPACVIEFDAGIDRFHVHLVETVDPDGGRRWSGTPVSSYREDGPEIPMAFPATLDFALSAEPGGDPDEPDIRFACTPRRAPYMGGTAEATRHAAETANLAFRRVCIGFLSALLLHNTLGLRKERVRVSAALNRARGRGRCRIPDHTVIHLESYAAADGAERRYDERGTVEVHLRRAHKRRVAHGSGRTERRWRLFPAQVVGYLPDGRKPGLAELIASRAARPYRVALPAGDGRAGQRGLVGGEGLGPPAPQRALEDPQRPGKGVPGHP